MPDPLSLVALAPGVVPQGQAQQNAAGANNSALGITRLAAEPRIKTNGCSHVDRIGEDVLKPVKTSGGPHATGAVRILHRQLPGGIA